MDIARPDHARKVRRRRMIYTVLAVLAVLAVSAVVMSLEPAAPSVDRASLLIDRVHRGEMLREVRGPGTLVPEEERWVPALTQGRVEKLLIKPGAEVRADTIIMELSNPTVQQAYQDAQLALNAAVADYETLKVTLESEFLNHRASAAQVRADHREAELQAEANRELSKDQLISDIDLSRSIIRAENLSERVEIEAMRLDKTAEANVARLGAEQAKLEQARALFDLRRRELESLKVRASLDGILQQIPLEEGEQVSPGTRLAKVAQPDKLKAELRIAETQARDLQVGQAAKIDTRNGLVPGRVIHVDPAAQEGTVTVEVSLEGELPRGARPQLSVDGTIEIERLDDTLYVKRAAYGQAHSKIGLFKLIEDGSEAIRVPVQLGRSSVNLFEIVDGLVEGDEIILSDTSAWDDHDRIRIR